VYVSTPEKEYFSASIPTKVVNTVGAGDAFTACFVAMLARGHGISTALRAGLLNSASVLGYADAQTGILTYQEIVTALAR
jgi:sugar/nucleoside kinase (ribokinase family)